MSRRKGATAGEFSLSSIWKTIGHHTCDAGAARDDDYDDEVRKCDTKDTLDSGYTEYTKESRDSSSTSSSNSSSTAHTMDDRRRNSAASPTSALEESKKSLVEIVMRVTELAEEIFLFGTQSYHKNPSKRSRLESEESSGSVRDFTLPTEEVYQLATASPSLLDTDL